MRKQSRILAFISVKNTYPHGGNLRAEKIKNSGAQFFVCAFFRYLVPCLHHAKIRAPRDPFSRNLEPNRGPETSLSCLKSMSIYYSLGNYKLSICSYLCSIATQSFSDNNFELVIRKRIF